MTELTSFDLVAYLLSCSILNKTNENNEFDKYALKIELDELVKAGLSLSSASSYLAKKKNLTKKLKMSNIVKTK